MPFVTPFKGLRYNPAKVPSLKEVVTPPYDVISPRGQTRYYERHRWNFVRVVFGKSHSSDRGKRNRYSRARQTLREWMKDRVLVVDEEPSIYPYIQEYRLGKRWFRRSGVIALVRLDSPKIFRHEGTREGPKKDRLRLLKTVQASLSPIFGLIPDSEGSYNHFIEKLCRSRQALHQFRLDGVRHRLWKVSDPAALRQFEKLLRPKELVIADGHHRFEAALAYRNWRRKRNPSATAPYNFAMFYLMAASTAEEPGLLPTHRVVRSLSPKSLSALLQKLSSQGSVRPLPKMSVLLSRLEQFRQKGKLAVGLYSGNGAGYLLKAPGQPPYELDVEWLHQELLPSLSVDADSVSYTQDLPEGLRQVQQGKARALFIVQRPRLREVFRRARAGARMPGKTTYFYPKPLAGLVEYKF